VEEGEWGDFVKNWHADIVDREWRMDIWEEFRNNHNGPEWPNNEQGFSSAIQVFIPNAWKIQHTVELENSMEFLYEFKMVKNGPIYGYKLVAEKCLNR
jgi:hypothetical protein